MMQLADLAGASRCASDVPSELVRPVYNAQRTTAGVFNPPSEWPEVATANDATHELGIVLVTFHYMISFGYMTQLADLAGASMCAPVVCLRNLFDTCTLHRLSTRRGTRTYFFCILLHSHLFLLYLVALSSLWEAGSPTATAAWWRRKAQPHHQPLLPSFLPCRACASRPRLASPNSRRPHRRIAHPPPFATIGAPLVEISSSSRPPLSLPTHYTPLYPPTQTQHHTT